MTPAAFAQTETSRETFTARRIEATRRSPRRSTLAFSTGAQTPLFHAWRP